MLVTMLLHPHHFTVVLLLILVILSWVASFCCECWVLVNIVKQTVIIGLSNDSTCNFWHDPPSLCNTWTFPSAVSKPGDAVTYHPHNNQNRQESIIYYCHTLYTTPDPRMLEYKKIFSCLEALLSCCGHCTHVIFILFGCLILVPLTIQSDIV